ncbi:ABC transporter permease subunit [Salipiger mucosus]|uniref:Putative ABC transporter, permease protein n=1 Tax=Salipiger mucosus DSM 16094 TaxID=1123237 RepID=S9Q9I2_9RHOB|nr:ABC transporter permease subunit [Salipiger mucosus]EPX76617.1 putative ABC transporter, permease protein [Salipiger mucosus DSM 16094]
MAELSATAVREGKVREKKRFNPVWLAAPGVAFLLFFMVMPMGQIFHLSVHESSGEFTWRFMEKAMAPGLYARVLGMTFSVSLQVMLWCVVLGYPLALWLARMEGRAQHLAAFCILLPFWTSPLIKNFSWMVLLGRTGFVAGLAESIGLSPEALLYSNTTVIFAMTHTLMPLAIITMLPALQQVDRRVLQASATLGATGGQGFWTVMLPLSMRGISAAGLLIFVTALGFFITPALLGGPQQTMIGQLIIMQINQLQNWQQGAALAVVLLVTALVAVFVFDRVFGISSVTGGSGAPRRHDHPVRRLGIRMSEGMGKIARRLGGGMSESTARRVHNTFAGVMVFLLLVPVLAFVPMAFEDSVNLYFPPETLSTRWFAELFEAPVWRSAILRSLGVGLATAALTLVIGGLAALALVQGRGKAATPIFLLFLTPMIIPPIALAVSMFYLFAQIGLVATNLGIIIGHCVIAMPIVFVVLLTTFKGYDWRLNDVSLTLGASRLQSWRRITLPLMKGGLIAGFVTGFLQSFDELTVALFVGGGLKTTLPRQMWDSINLQATPIIAAASVLVLVIVLLFFGAMELAQMRRRTATKG